MTPYTVYTHPGWGSAMVEAMLDLAGLPYQLVRVDPWEDDQSAARLRAVNPLCQLPTVVLPDGAVMTESAAIALHVAEVSPRPLAPPVGDPQRPAFLRWLVFLVSNIYPTCWYADFAGRLVDDGAAAKTLEQRAIERRCELWRILDGSADAAGPWFLGARLSVIDVFIGVMTDWTPGRAWFAEHCPRLHAIALAVTALPELKAVVARHFEQP